MSDVPVSPVSAGAPRRVDRNREILDERASCYTYKEIGGVQLDAYVVAPEGHRSSDRRPCFIFFFGSKWDNGVVSQFAPQCVYFASRGAVGIVVDYRLGSKHGTEPLDALADGKSAIRWARQNADVLGIDPERIICGGASGGAFLALGASMIDGYDEPDEERDVSSQPNGMILFSPAVSLLPDGFGFEKIGDKKLAKKISPLRTVKKGLPPTIVFHGTADRVVPFAGVAKFCKRMKRKRNKCELVDFEGQGHGFFNFNVDARYYEATIAAADRFFVENGLLDASDEDVDSLRLN